MKKTKQLFIDRHEGGERAILVQINFNRLVHTDDLLAEFHELVRSANVDALDTITGKREAPDAKYFVGRGKAHQIEQAVKFHQADVVLFNHELSPGQARNLEKLLNVRVLDRTELILDIFAQRARTFEGKLQVELAQLQHLSTRLVRGWTHLERQKGGIGLRGPGETQLETDRRLLGVRIGNIKKRLKKVEKQRNEGRRARQRAEIPVVSLVGYTNAGKSTLFNRLTDSDIYAADQLFATLDPSLRHLQLPKLGKIIVADTVGFIRELPHDLVAAFRATLEETRQATLLLHVIDCQQPDYAHVVQEVVGVLREIEANKVPRLQVFNKIDLEPGFKPRIDYHPNGKPKRVWLSAHTGDGMELLNEAVTALLEDKVIHREVKLAANEGKLRAKLYKLGVVKKETVNEQGEMILQLEIQRADYQRLFGA